MQWVKIMGTLEQTWKAEKEPNRNSRTEKHNV